MFETPQPVKANIELAMIRNAQHIEVLDDHELKYR